MNVLNEHRPVESDEETFMDQHGRSLHLVGADLLQEQERPTLRRVMARPGTPEPALCARALGDRSLRSTALRATRIRKSVIIIAWRPW
jgi:hypothetical protein